MFIYKIHGKNVLKAWIYSRLGARRVRDDGLLRWQRGFCLRVASRQIMDRNGEIRQRTACLFDVDGTLTKPRQNITPEMENFLQALRTKVVVGLICGSDLVKIKEQMGGEDVVKRYDYVFAENGLVAYKDGVLIAKQNILEHMGEQKLQTFINFCLLYMSSLTLPAKRGNFVEFRNGLINICPVGRSCNQYEREQFHEYDKKHKIREKFVEAVRDKFPDLGLSYAIGGQISFDAFPTGWDKTFCLQYLPIDDLQDVYFFGDRTMIGGNDYEIYNHPRTKGHTVSGPEDTKAQVARLFF